MLRESFYICSNSKMLNLKLSIIIIFLALAGNSIYAWQSDNGDGTFSNPVLYADYPDPDIIRVGEDFYMVSTTFVNSPGINVLHSQDLVNWEIISHAASTVDGGDAYNMVGGTAYRGGFWASSIRYHDGTFYVVVNPTFANARIYYTDDPAGPWLYHQLDRGAYDPGFFIEDDGTGYIFYGSGTQSVLTLNSDYSAVVSQTNNVVNGGGEGSHVIKRGSYYYLFNANPGVWPFQLRCSRAMNIFGPWETGHICLLATTGGHQGAIVDIDDSDNWFGFVHQDSGAVGRMPRIGPVFWENDWPVFGTPSNRDVIASTYTKPSQGKPLMQPPTSDDFASSTLGLQWQWNHNPDNTRWSLTERPGWLRLKATQSDGFWTARNTLTQKGQGPWSRGEVKFDLQNLQPGDICGFGTLGKYSAHIAVNCDNDGNLFLSMNVLQDTSGGIQTDMRVTSVPIQSSMIMLRTDLDFENDTGICSYSFDGEIWTPLGGEFPLAFDWATGTFQGEQFAIFCYNPNPTGGYVDVDSFTFSAGIAIPRGRPHLNAAGTTFVADNNNLLRGPFASTEWGDPPPYDNIEAIKNLGCNAIHLYAECYDPDYPDPGSTAPGYSVSRVDDMVDMTRQLGLYLVITIGNGSNNGAFNYDYVIDFWDFYAPRYADETHVLYEIQNEPYAWGPNYDQPTLDMEADAYTLIRSHAPDTPILLFSYAVLTNGAAAVADIASVSAAASVDWSNAGVAFHGYGGHFNTPDAVDYITADGYPCFMTEFAAYDWGGGHGLDVELTSELERLNVSWLSFLHIPPNFISSAITDPDAFKDMVDRAGMSWTPDYGYWPVARGVYGNGGQPRATTTTWVSNFLIGTLRIEAEDFDIGGQDVAYSDTDSTNQGGQYRTTEGVDIETTSDTGGGYNIGWTSSGEWLEYTIWVKEPGFYDLGLRIASIAEGSVQVFCDAEDKTGTWALPNTGGWQTWTTVTKEVFLGYGLQKLRLNITSGAPNVNWLELSPATTAPVANGTYKLMNRNSGMAMEYDTGTDHVVQDTYSGVSIQKWNLQHLGAGQYKVTSALNNDSWNVWSGPGNTLDMVWWWNIDARHQRFVVRPIGYGYYRIAPVALGFDFEVEGASMTSGAAILQNEFMGDAHQQWGILSPSAPAFPTALNAVWVSSDRIDLTWTASDGATSYNVKRSTTSGGPYTTLDTNVTTPNYSDTTVVAGTIYYYVVSANTAAGESLNSNEAEANPNRMHAYLNFDESSGTTASDVTGNGWDGTLVSGPLWSTGKYHNAVNLDGSNDYVSLPTGVVVGLTDFTISAWVYLDTVSVWSRIFDFGNDTNVYMFLTPSNGSTNVVRFAITTGSAGGEQVINGDDPLPTGAWTHVAVTLVGNTGILYVNGAEVGRNSSMSLTPDSIGITTQNYIGKSQWTWDAYLDGRVDDFRIYSSALSPAEVAALASNDQPYFTSDPIDKPDAIEDAAYTGQTLAADAIDPDSDPLVFSKVSGPDWLNVSADGSISGTPSDSDTGPNVFTVRVEDTRGLYDMAVMNIYVANIYSGVRGLEDVEGLANNWLSSDCTDTPACDGADLDGDKDVDFLDFAILANTWKMQ